MRAVVADEELERVDVRSEWGLDGPVSNCECGARAGEVCGHAAALGLLLVGDAVPRGAAVAEGGPPGSLAERELHVRRDRGASELLAVKAHPATKFSGHYDVHSPSSRSYEVTLRALDEPHNGCACPDLATNLLGSRSTCRGPPPLSTTTSTPGGPR